MCTYWKLCVRAYKRSTLSNYIISKHIFYNCYHITTAKLKKYKQNDFDCASISYTRDYIHWVDKSKMPPMYVSQLLTTETAPA